MIQNPAEDNQQHVNVISNVSNARKSNRSTTTRNTLYILLFLDFFLKHSIIAQVSGLGHTTNSTFKSKRSFNRIVESTYVAKPTDLLLDIGVE
jgi:hypothetical protein